MIYRSDMRSHEQTADVVAATIEEIGSLVSKTTFYKLRRIATISQRNKISTNHIIKVGGWNMEERRREIDRLNK